MCRLYCRRISTLKPEFDAAGVSLVAVGFEELGVQEFVDGKFFDGGEFKISLFSTGGNYYKG